MAGYLYETHMHTQQGSACSDTPGRDYVKKYQDAGYSGIIITDHFYRGNCRPQRSLPWADFISAYCSGYEEAAEEGDKLGFPVFFGIEEYIDGDEYLVYGPDKAWLLQHPEMIHWSRAELYRHISEAGGCVVQAHPFRARWYLDTIRLSPFFVDAVEGVNAANEPQWNSLALRYAKVLGLPVTAGSDNHHADRMAPDNLAGVVLDSPLTSIQDYVDRIKNRRPMGLHQFGETLAWTPDMQPELPLVWYDRNENPCQVDITEILATGKVPEK